MDSGQCWTVCFCGRGSLFQVFVTSLFQVFVGLFRHPLPRGTIEIFAPKVRPVSLSRIPLRITTSSYLFHPTVANGERESRLVHFSCRAKKNECVARIRSNTLFSAPVYICNCMSD